VFLGTFNDEQKRAFLLLADTVINADRRLAPQEATMIALMRAEMGLPDGEPVPAMDETAAVAAFGERRARVAAMLELIGLGLGDAEMAPEEVAVITRIGVALGFSEAEILGQRDWVLRQVALMHEANAMMLGEN
jgi:uncharacterized tellurite resistance protein B-like protein